MRTFKNSVQSVPLPPQGRLIKYGLDWSDKTWTGLIKHGVIKHGLIKHALIKLLKLMLSFD